MFGDDLKTFSELRAGKGALERHLRVPFYRFCTIFEILRVLWETILSENSDFFSDSIFDHFLGSFW